MEEIRKRGSGQGATRGVVKSAARALDVLELFRKKRRALSAAEIGKALGYPRSSASVLLRSLAARGYLVLDARTMHYFPSLHVTRLGEWIPRAMLVPGKVLDVLEDVHAVPRETVTLCVCSAFQPSSSRRSRATCRRRCRWGRVS